MKGSFPTELGSRLQCKQEQSTVQFESCVLVELAARPALGLLPGAVLFLFGPACAAARGRYFVVAEAVTERERCYA